MPRFFKPSSSGENRIENAGRWPIRLTRFHLSGDYDFPATNYPEFFLVEKGGLLYETDTGKQTLRENFAMVVHPGHRHQVRNAADVVLSRVRYLPEWFTMDYSAITGMPDVLTLFFDQSWLQYPREDSFHVFSMREETRELITGELGFLRQSLISRNHLSPLPRLSLLKIMALAAGDFQRFWRGAANPEIKAATRFALDGIERCVLSGEPLREPELADGPFDKLEIEATFRAFTGLGIVEYTRRRRILHAAFALIATDDDERQIGKATGFPDTTGFLDAFEETFEISPRVYREKFRSLTGPEETPQDDD